MPKIFCSYRRQDSTHQTGRIFDQLTARFGKDELFRDVDSMPLGLDFRRVLSEQVAHCDVLLAIIGDEWLKATEKTGERRLDNPNDFVRIEIESALGRNIPVIPVLVGQAPMPNPDDLPKGLRELAFRNGIAVRADPDFHHDVARLIRGINDVLSAATPQQSKKIASLENTRSYLLKNVLGRVAEGEPKGAPAPIKAPIPVAGQAVGQEHVALPTPAPPAAQSERSRSPRRKGLLWGASVLTLLAAGTTVAVLVTRDRDKAFIDPNVQVEVRREVDSMRRQRTELAKAEPPTAFDEGLHHLDYTSFDILRDERVFDLREWKPVPPEQASEKICGVSMVRRIKLRKTAEAAEVRFDFRTTGLQLDVFCTSHPNVRVTPPFVEDKRTKVRQMIIDVHDIPVGPEFDVRIVATYWNSLQKDDDLWFGAMGYKNSSIVSFLVVFPEQKPFKDYALKVAPTRQGKPEDFRDSPRILFPSENRDFVYWKILNPKLGYVYSLNWTW